MFKHLLIFAHCFLLLSAQSKLFNLRPILAITAQGPLAVILSYSKKNTVTIDGDPKSIQLTYQNNRTLLSIVSKLNLNQVSQPNRTKVYIETNFTLNTIRVSQKAIFQAAYLQLQSPAVVYANNGFVSIGVKVNSVLLEARNQGTIGLNRAQVALLSIKVAEMSTITIMNSTIYKLDQPLIQPKSNLYINGQSIVKWS